MTTGTHKQDQRDRSRASLEFIRRRWAKAPNMPPEVENGGSTYRVVVGEYESREKAERVRLLIDRAMSDMAELYVHAEAHLCEEDHRHTLECEECGDEFGADRATRRFCSRQCSGRAGGRIGNKKRWG